MMKGLNVLHVIRWQVFISNSLPKSFCVRIVYAKQWKKWSRSEVKKNIKINLKTKHVHDYLEIPLIDFIKELKDVPSDIPFKNIMIEFCIEDGYHDESGEINYEMFYYRDETDDEYSLRMQNENMEAGEIKQEEIAEYLRLREKYRGYRGLE